MWLKPRLHQLTEMYYDRKLNTTSDPLTYISIHVRRSDYGMYLNYWYKKTYVEDEYFARAVQFYRNKFSVSLIKFSGCFLPRQMPVYHHSLRD